MPSKARILTRIQAKAAAGRRLSRPERRQLRKADGEAPQPGYQVEGERAKARAAERARTTLSGVSIGAKR